MLAILAGNAASARVSSGIKAGLASAYSTYERVLHMPQGGDKQRLLAAQVKRERKAAKALSDRWHIKAVS